MNEMVSAGDTVISFHTHVFIFEVVGGGGSTLNQLKSKRSKLSDNFYFRGWADTLDTAFRKYLSRVTQGILTKKFSQPSFLLYRR